MLQDFLRCWASTTAKPSIIFQLPSHHFFSLGEGNMLNLPSKQENLQTLNRLVKIKTNQRKRQVKGFSLLPYSHSISFCKCTEHLLSPPLLLCKHCLAASASVENKKQAMDSFRSSTQLFHPENSSFSKSPTTRSKGKNW